MWNYSDTVMDHYRNPRNVGVLEDADAIGEAGSLACGDMLKIYLKINDKGIVTDAKFQTFGCGSAVAASSMLTEMVIGKPIDEVKKITNKDIVDALGGLPPEKMHCSVMGHEALEDALKEFFHEENKPKAEKIICQCFDVTEKQIIEAIKENGLTTVEQVTNYTKAGGGCGHCKKNIQVLLDKYAPKQAPLTKTQQILKINRIIETQISPELQKDGGDIELVDISDNKVYVKLRGACSGCRNATLTLKNFVENTLHESVSKDLEVIEA